MRVLLVDDEAPARAELRYLLEREGVAIAGEASTAGEALALLEHGGVDAVFCDIEMPGLSGLDAARLIRESPGRPVVVFVTAYERYAVDAFAVEALDYVLKPVDPVRLARVLERLRETDEGGRPVVRIPVVGGGNRTTLLDADSVVFVRAEGDYSRVQTFDRSYLCTSPLGELETTLPAARFARVHRSTLVNLAKVGSVGHAGPDRLRLIMDDRDRTEIDVSRRLTPQVRERLRL